ncbi:hypothetical protein SLEP1_g3309 [Rubroshorea leprosula]|uniref:Wall-associated receptor kinase galacturonan-binding domain-containing protein n=1 Tax=Rubroshorea leprosula TaxID=152421 RepID=A0AAV5HVS7_9ROSI|nr:hypothetical protein SLEP1_g3309 [Rubroshorea leprosula]
MLRRKLILVFSLMALALSLCPDACMARAKYKPCPTFSSCGNLSIMYPFRLNTDPVGCGLPEYELVCENNRTTLVMEQWKFFVESIIEQKSAPLYFVENGTKYTLRLVDATLRRDKCSIPRSSLVCGSCRDFGRYTEYSDSADYTMYILNCNIPINSSLYVDASACTNRSSSPYTYFFLFHDSQTKVSDFNESCRIEALFPFSLSNITGFSASDIYHKLLEDYELTWSDFSFRGDKLTLKKM